MANGKKQGAKHMTTKKKKPKVKNKMLGLPVSGNKARRKKSGKP